MEPRSKLGREPRPQGLPWDLEGTVCRNTKCILHSKSWQCCPRTRGTRLGGPPAHHHHSVPPLTCPGHTASLWPRNRAPSEASHSEGPYPQDLGITEASGSQVSTIQACSSSTLRTARAGAESRLLPGIGGCGGSCKPDGIGGDAKGQRFVLVDYIKSSSPNLLGQQNEKAGPFLGGVASDGTTEPTKKKKQNKESDPNLASASGSGVWGWGWRLQARASPGGKDTTQPAVVQVGARAPPRQLKTGLAATCSQSSGDAS